MIRNFAATCAGVGCGYAFLFMGAIVFSILGSFGNYSSGASGDYLAICLLLLIPMVPFTLFLAVLVIWPVTCVLDRGRYDISIYRWVGGVIGAVIAFAFLSTVGLIGNYSFIVGGGYDREMFILLPILAATVAGAVTGDRLGNSRRETSG